MPRTQKQKEPKWWVIAILAPIIVGLVLFVPDFIKEKLSKNKYGELLIESNVDSAKVFLNKEFKEYTLSSRAIPIVSLRPGNYVLSIEKNGFAVFVDPNVKIDAGEITSIKADLKFTPAQKEGLSVTTKLIESDSIQKKQNRATEFYKITIAVHSKLKNANVMIDGKWTANAPNTISLPKGRYRLRIENETYYYEEMLRVPSRVLVNVTEDEIKLNDLP